MSHEVTHPDRCFPRLHPRPASGWVNDPNGIHYTDGRWQLFFQYNPTSARHHHIVWGHLSSADLVNWRDEGVAIEPQPGTDDEFGCWSGVGVIDEGVPTLVYSGVRESVFSERNGSQVMLARAGEGGRWVQSPHVAAGMPASEAIVGVRDPFLFEFAGRRWGILGAGVEPDVGAVLLYDASDLTAWQERGFLFDATGRLGHQVSPATTWECPQLVRVGDDWVLIVSPWNARGVGPVTYLIGSLELDESGMPRFVPRAVGVLDDGLCYYAPQAAQAGAGDGGPERALVWAWTREVVGEGVRGRTQEDADAVGWSGLLTFPRELVVDGDAVRTVPARELDALRGEPTDPYALPDQAEVLLTGAGRVELRLAVDGDGGQLLWSADLAGSARVLIDASLVEIFPDAATSFTLRAYPTDGECYRLVAAPGVQVSACSLRTPEQ